MPDGVLIDGDFNGPVQASQWKISHPIPQQPTALVGRAEFWQLAEKWNPLVNNSAGPLLGEIGGSAQQSYSVGETELEDMGAGLVRWERIYATMPVTHTEESSIAKTIKYLLSVWVDGVYKTANVVSTTKTVRCHIVYDYGFSIGALPLAPDVVLYTPIGASGSSAWLIGGFPGPSAAAPNQHNEGFSFIQGEITPYLGGIKVRKRIYGPV